MVTLIASLTILPAWRFWDWRIDVGYEQYVKIRMQTAGSSHLHHCPHPQKHGGRHCHSMTRGELRGDPTHATGWPLVMGGVATMYSTRPSNGERTSAIVLPKKSVM